METERLRFRKIDDGDFDNLKAIISDPETMKYYSKPYGDEGVYRWIRWCKDCYEKHRFGLLALVLKSSGEFIGDCGITLQNINGREVYEIGYHINKKYHNKGYGSEASRYMRDFFFSSTEYDEVYSYMNAENIPSRRLAEKNGMSLVEVYEDDGMTLTVYKITRREWEALVSANKNNV